MLHPNLTAYDNFEKFFSSSDAINYQNSNQNIEIYEYWDNVGDILESEFIVVGEKQPNGS